MLLGHMPATLCLLAWPVQGVGCYWATCLLHCAGLCRTWGAIGPRHFEGDALRALENGFTLFRWDGAG